MPTPEPGQTKDEFMNACIPMVIDDGTAKDPDQAVAICSSIWERRAAPDNIRYRSAIIPSNPDGPTTYDPATGSFELILATQDPIPMWDDERMDVIPEILLARGCRIPKKVPMLDSHDRWSTRSVIGSLRNFRREDAAITARAYFSSVPNAEEVKTKYLEGHLTDFSAGYAYNPKDIRHVPKGEEANFGGQTWRGGEYGLNVVIGWDIREGSCCALGADPAAKARSGRTRLPSRPESMDIALRRLLERCGLPSEASETRAWEFYLQLSINP